MFCPKCGSLLKPLGDGFSSCSCGYKTKSREVLTEKTPHKKSGVEVVSEINPFATEHHICPKCGFDKAVLIESQIAVRETWNNSEADKPSFVCSRCGYKDFID